MCFDCYAKASGKREEKEAEKAMETKQDMNHLFFSPFFMRPNTSMVAVANFLQAPKNGTNSSEAEKLKHKHGGIAF